MWLLSIDTSSKEASVALLRDGRLVALVAPKSEEQHSVQLFHSLRQALGEAGLLLPDVNVYAVANGPGAFTALRVGLTVVKGLAEMHSKPVIPVSVLEAVAESAAAQGLLVPIMDAYRGQIFAGLYQKADGDVVRRGAERVLALEEFLAALEAAGARPRECTLVSPQMDRWAERLSGTAFSVSRRESVSPVLAEAVARRAVRKLEHGETLDALHLEANYVRRSDAELLWKQK
ncbi:MAG: tRNA (adenosine(37)-N6)-threonylcarbamoyltransferase complex dimerization subunit type 1 TsaB [Candidatus Acidoferrales bacterium]